MQDPLPVDGDFVEATASLPAIGGWRYRAIAERRHEAPKSTAPELAAELADRAAEGVPKSQLAREYGLSRETVYQYLRRGQAPAENGPAEGPGVPG